MPAPKAEEPLESVRVNLFAGDSKRLAKVEPNMRRGTAIRHIVRAYIRSKERKQKEQE